MFDGKLSGVCHFLGRRRVSKTTKIFSNFVEIANVAFAELAQIFKSPLPWEACVCIFSPCQFGAICGSSSSRKEPVKSLFMETTQIQVPSHGSLLVRSEGRKEAK